MQTVTPCLWFDTDGEEAANFYVSVFPNSRIVNVARYGSAGPRPEGMVMTVEFELDGQPFVALNGGPDFSFSEAVSFQVSCETQEQVDRYWSTLSEGGEEGPCGWLKDKYGLSWQVVPSALHAPPRGRRCRAVAARDGRHAEDGEDRDRRARAGGSGRLVLLNPRGSCERGWKASEESGPQAAVSSSSWRSSWAASSIALWRHSAARY